MALKLLKKPKPLPPPEDPPAPTAAKKKRGVGEKANITHAEIIDAVRREFALSPSVLRMAKLAHRLEVSPRALYSYFPSGQAAIIVATVKDALDRCALPVELGEHGNAYLARLVALARALFAECPGLAAHVGGAFGDNPFVSVAFADRLIGALRHMGVAKTNLHSAFLIVGGALAGFLASEFPVGAKHKGWTHWQEKALGDVHGHLFPALVAAKQELASGISMAAAESAEAIQARTERLAAFLIAGVSALGAGISSAEK